MKTSIRSPWSFACDRPKHCYVIALSWRQGERRELTRYLVIGPEMVAQHLHLCAARYLVSAIIIIIVVVVVVVSVVANNIV